MIVNLDELRSQVVGNGRKQRRDAVVELVREGEEQGHQHREQSPDELRVGRRPDATVHDDPPVPFFQHLPHPLRSSSLHPEADKKERKVRQEINQTRLEPWRLGPYDMLDMKMANFLRILDNFEPSSFSLKLCTSPLVRVKSMQIAVLYVVRCIFFFNLEQTLIG